MADSAAILPGQLAILGRVPIPSRESSVNGSSCYLPRHQHASLDWLWRLSENVADVARVQDPAAIARTCVLEPADPQKWITRWNFGQKPYIAEAANLYHYALNLRSLEHVRQNFPCVYAGKQMLAVRPNRIGND